MAAGVGGVPLTLRALWWRRGVSLVILVVAVLTVAAAAVAPTYARAAGESVLRDRLAEAPVADVGTAFEGYTRPGDPATTAELAGTLPSPGSQRWYPTRIASLVEPSTVHVTEPAHPRPPTVVTQLVWRDGACEHVVLVAGRCPTAPGEVAITARTAAATPQWRVGTRAVIDRIGVPVQVVGVYLARSQSDPYWFGRAYFNAHPFKGWGDGPDTVDAFLTDRSTFTSLPTPTEVPYTVDYPLDVSAVRLDDVPAMRAGTQAWASGPAAALGAELRTALPDVLDRIESELRLLDLAALVVCVQLALLAGLVLFQVVADTTEARGNEVALAKLRGLPPRSTLGVALAEPVALLVMAVPLGVLAAWWASAWLASAYLLPGTPVRITAGTWLAAAAAMAGGAVASALAARRTLTRPVLEQWSGTPPSRSRGRAGLVVDVVVATLALAGFAALGSRASGDSAATGLLGVATLLAPGLLVLAVALLAVRLVPLAARLGLAPTRASRHVGAFLSLRQVARRPAGLRLAMLLAVALGLAVFAVGAESAATANRASRAALELGAADVLRVSYEPGHDPLSVTRAVDPEGRWAMAAARWLPDGGTVTGAVLAVDAGRLPAVSRWDAAGTGLAATTAAGTLTPAVPPPVAVAGDALRLRLDAQDVQGAAPLVTLLLRDREGFHTVETQPLRPGTASYQADIRCGPDCRLEQVGFDRRATPDSPLRATVTVLGLDERRDGAWEPVAAGFSRPGEWRPTAPPGVEPAAAVSVVDGRLVTTIATRGSESAAIEHVDTPDGVPAYVAGGVAPAGPSATVEDAQGHVAPLVPLTPLPRLPVLGGKGVVVDLATLQAFARGTELEAQWSVLLGEDAPADAVARLTDAGLLVDGTESASARADLLGRQGPALALRLLLACAVAGACLAAAAVAIAVAVTGRRRSFELAALRAVGVPRRSLLGACVGEQVMLLGAGLLVGIPAGVLAARLSLPLIPQFADSTATLMTYVPRVPPIVALALAATLAVLVVAWVAGVLVLRAAVPSRLREADR